MEDFAHDQIKVLLLLNGSSKEKQVNNRYSSLIKIVRDEKIQPTYFRLLFMIRSVLKVQSVIDIALELLMHKYQYAMHIFFFLWFIAFQQGSMDQGIDKDLFRYGRNTPPISFFQNRTQGEDLGRTLGPLGWTFWTITFYDLKKFTLIPF